MEAQESRLPAMHVAALSSKADVVRAYVEAVVGFKDQLPEKEIVQCLDLRCNGESLFHIAMIKGTGVVVDACVSTILASGLLPKYKISLIDARRQYDNLGAFYLAMSLGHRETALAMVQGVLSSPRIDSKTKVQLLRCAKLKPKFPPKGASNSPAGKALEQAASTARAEAERMKRYKLLTEFDMQVEQSMLPPGEKETLQKS